MPGHCYSCADTFGLFKKEYGCKNCGYAFCKECLPKKVPVPKLKNETHRVCRKCYDKLTGNANPSDDAARYSPPEAYKKRMAALQDQQPNRPPKRMALPGGNTKNTYQGMSKEDRELAERLDRLKESRKKDEPVVPSQSEMEARLAKLKKDGNAPPTPSTSEMTDRLAKLQGREPSQPQSPHVFTADRRLQSEQVDDLLQEICDEVAIDSHYLDPATDVGNRLDSLRGGGAAKDIEQNLNTDDGKAACPYSKDIPTFDSKFKSASGEEVDWSEMNKLVQQMASELNIDANKAIEGLKKDKGLWQRLQNLKQKKEQQNQRNKDNSNAKTASSSTVATAPSPQNILPEPEENEEEDEETEEEATQRILKQLLEESRLEEIEERELIGDRVGTMVDSTAPLPPGDYKKKSNIAKGPSGGGYQADPDELPWCCICNNDASVRCLGCDGDLYCNRCYKEGHDRFDMEDHPTTAFKAPAKGNN